MNGQKILAQTLARLGSPEERAVLIQGALEDAYALGVEVWGGDGGNEHVHSPERQGANQPWEAERASALFQLRELCKEFGDNDFPDDLDLGDAIANYLGKPLYVRERALKYVLCS